MHVYLHTHVCMHVHAYICIHTHTYICIKRERGGDGERSRHHSLFYFLILRSKQMVLKTKILGQRKPLGRQRQGIRTANGNSFYYHMIPCDLPYTGPWLPAPFHSCAFTHSLPLTFMFLIPDIVRTILGNHLQGILSASFTVLDSRQMNYLLVNRQERTVVSLDAKLCLPRQLFPTVFPGKEQRGVTDVGCHQH